MHKLFIIIGLISIGSSAVADPAMRRKSETSGLAVAAGVGYQYGLLGGQLIYYIELPTLPLRIAPYIGGGSTLGSDEQDIAARAGYSAGTMISFFRSHRLVLDLNYGLLLTQSLALHGSGIGTRSLYGVSLAAGYEWMLDVGVFLRGQGGIGFILDDLGLSNRSQWQPVFNLAVGYKLW